MSGAADAPLRRDGSLAEAPATDTSVAAATLSPASSAGGALAPVLSRALSRAEEAALHEARQGSFVRDWADWELAPG